MKGTFFQKSVEWNVQTKAESWTQGGDVSGTIKIINHSAETISLANAGVGIAFADIKKIHTKTQGALKFDARFLFGEKELLPNSSVEQNFSLLLPTNCPVSDKKSSYYLTYGMDCEEAHLQLKVTPHALYGKIIGLMDTFQRFKLKEVKSSKKGVEYKLLPPSSRDMANLESLALILALEEELLHLNFEFQVKRLDTSAITTKVSKETISFKKSLTPKEYSLGPGMINQDQLLKILESVVAEVKLKSVF